MSTDIIQRLSAILVLAFVTSACETIKYDPATNADTSPPATNLLIKRAGAPDLEVQNLVTPSPRLANTLEPLPANGRWDFSVLATATDAESGIRSIKLNMTRTVCYIASGGGVAQAYSGTVTRKEATYTAANAPKQASLGDTGVIDNTDRAKWDKTEPNLLLWTNANGDRNVGVGVATKWNMEAVNFAGLTTYSGVIYMNAGNLGCNPPP